MSDKPEDTGVVTSILTRRPARPFKKSIIEEAVERADELEGQAHPKEKKPGLKILVGRDEAPDRPEEREDDLDLHVDDLERRIEALEGRQNATLVVLGFLAAALAIAGLFF